MGLYAGIDLHSTSMQLGIVGVGFKRVYEKKLGNDLFDLLEHLEPFRADLQGIAVESTYNWYWVVDGLMDHGYKQVHLANPCAMKQYEGLKHTDDRHDAFWLAKMLALGILPEGYIYPREDRPVRDLLRKRSFLVNQRTRLLLNLRSMIERETSLRLKGNQIAKLQDGQIRQLLGQQDLELSAKLSLGVVEQLNDSIKQIEKAVKARMRVRKAFQVLLTAPGIGDILAMTIMLEVGDIRRFEKVGDFSSYCRLVNTEYLSAGKHKGKGNRKNGNRYLAWAFTEAATIARRKGGRLNRFFQRKAAQTHPVAATMAVGNKLARACYYMMRDQVPFREEAMF